METRTATLTSAKPSTIAEHPTVFKVNSIASQSQEVSDRSEDRKIQEEDNVDYLRSQNIMPLNMLDVDTVSTKKQDVVNKSGKNGAIMIDNSREDNQFVEYEMPPDINGLNINSFDTSINSANFDELAPVMSEVSDFCFQEEEVINTSESIAGSQDNDVGMLRDFNHDDASGSVAGSQDNDIGLLRDFVHDDTTESTTGNSSKGIDLLRDFFHKDEFSNKSNAGVHRKFEAGDHVIRWKLLKAVLYPIQIHGIVLSVEDIDEASAHTENPKFKVVIADFGFTKSQSYDEETKKKGIKGINMNINKMMQSYYNSGKKDNERKSSNNFSNQESNHSSELGNCIELEDEFSGLEGISIDDEKLLKQNSNGKRFRVITITEPNDIKKWSKINYGSIFSVSGKLAKMKKWFSFRKTDSKNGKFPGNDTKDKKATSITKSNKLSFGNLDDIISPTTIDNKQVRNNKEAVATVKTKLSDEIRPKIEESDHQSKTLAQLMAEANEIEKKSRSRRRFSPRRSKKTVKSSSLLTTDTKSRSGRNIFTKSWFLGSSQKTESGANHYSPIHSQVESAEPGDNGNDINQSTSFTQSTPAESSALQGPKLPKSDPRKIVLARVKYILDQQDIPESESTLPPYHVLYSNSECLAVWCKTGSFSTLQAAVFLHSTAVGNAKSTVALTAAVVATQPWLIPLVGIYGIVAVGMPYYLLKRCRIKWKDSEAKLTDGFWSNADSAVFVAAIENWSALSKN